MAGADRPPEAQPRRNRLVQARLFGGIAVVLVAVAALALSRGAGEDPESGAPGVGGAGESLAVFEYRSGLDAWQDVQQPDGTERISVVDAPRSPDGSRPAARVMRVEIRPGDETDTGGYIANRSEVYGRLDERGVDPSEWPDPVGSTRWYGFGVFVPEGFCLSSDPENWLTLTQWKGLDGGSPPVAVEIKRGDLRLAGKYGRDRIGPIAAGEWTRLTVGLHLSPDPREGWAEVRRDGRTVVPRHPLQTMELLKDDGTERVDPIYLKQGLYRARSWTCNQALLFGPTTVARSLRELGNAA